MAPEVLPPGENTPESFGIAPDGRHLAAAISYHGFSVMTATGIAGVDLGRSR